MGYNFTLEEKAHDGVSGGYALNIYQMGFVRLLMIEAGVAAGAGFVAAGIGGPEMETCADTVPMENFLSNDGRHLTAHAADFIANRLRRAVKLGLVDHLICYLDDAPDVADFEERVEQFAAFNEIAARGDGYYVY
ncbi:hypothetical protein ABT301_20195 [Streptomyces sp. NPDC000987]|uniref:hypothetical protein n=1 Tax=Streptomyces sp. NPDC000987 TaxID=3154374 RepID=UPI00331A0097